MAVEQQSHWRPGKKRAPGYPEQCRQLTEARAEHAWLRHGSQMIQQQALRDFAHAMANFFLMALGRTGSHSIGWDAGTSLSPRSPNLSRPPAQAVWSGWIAE